ncbi:MAG: hypothetical protein JW908_05755 [Anaerolineales bacterium]|nr:hypothetical protein [Anaerolineales bacterium]
MKKTLVLALIVISLSFFLFGYWSGQNLNGFFSQLGNPSSAKARSNSDELPNHQQNILAVQVDNLDASKPNIESVWLMLYIKNTPKITWMPLYLTSSNANLISGHFQLSKDKTLNGKFESSLRKKDIWWNGYIITDKHGVKTLIDILDAASSNNTAITNVSGIETNAASLLDASDMEKVTVIQNICHMASSLDDFQGINAWLSNKANLVTDLPKDEITAQWINLLSAQNRLTCEFPSLLAIP